MEQKCPACGKIIDVPDAAAWKWRSGTSYFCNAECKEVQMTKLAMARKAAKMFTNGATEEFVLLTLTKEFGKEKAETFLASAVGKGLGGNKEEPKPEPKEPEKPVPEPAPEPPKEVSSEYVAVRFDEKLFNFDEISFSGKTIHRTEYNLDINKGCVSVLVETNNADRAELETIIKELVAVLKMMR